MKHRLYVIQRGVGSVGSHFPMKPCFMESGSCHSFYVQLQHNLDCVSCH